MTLPLLKKRLTTAPAVQAETSPKSFLSRWVARSASQSLLIGAVLVSSATAQQADQQHYAPPVHVQPAAWSVLESEAELHADGKAAPIPTAPIPTASVIPAATPPLSRGAEIAQMSHYMRAQNEAALGAKNAQVNAALYQLQQTKALAAQGQTAPRQIAPRPITQPFPRQANTAQPFPREARATQPFPRQANVPPQRTREKYAYPPNRVENTSRQQSQPSRPTQTANRTTRVPAPDRTANRTARGPAPTRRRVAANRQTQTQPGIGLQDRISNAFRKTFTRDNSTQQVAHAGPANRAPANRAPAGGGQARPARRAVATHAAVPHPATPTEVVSAPQSKPSIKVAYRSDAAESKVIVPSFVDATPELELASAQQAVGSGVRRPRVQSHSQPLSHGASPQENSIFHSASTQEDEDPTVDERLRKIDSEFDSEGENELPERSSDEPRLDLDDDNDDDEDSAAADARRIRSEIEAELDALDDDGEEVLDDDIFDEDQENQGPPVFDERGCEELREMLMGTSIRDISLDVSPPASPRRFEIGTISRNWTDTSGNVLATGTMTDLRRGYVILDSGLKLPYSKLGEADWNAIAENWLLPSGCSIGHRGNVGRHWTPQTVSWQASNLCHKTLYFENVQLERYGHSRGPFAQPVHSTFHFFASLLFIPYQTAIHPPNECNYALGYYRPGSCAPWIIEPIPFSREGIRRQALASVGAAFFP